MNKPNKIVVCAYSGDPFAEAMKMELAPPSKPEHHEKWFLTLSKFFGEMVDMLEAAERPFYTSITTRKWLYGVIRLYTTPFARYVIVNGFVDDDMDGQEAKIRAQDVYEDFKKNQDMDTLTRVMLFETPSDDPSIVRMVIDLDQINRQPHNGGV